MKPDELFESFASLLTVYIYTWFQCLISPLKMVARVLAATDDEQRFKQAVNIWVISFTLSLFCQLTVLYSVGLSLENIDFQISYMLSSTFVFLVMILMIHGGLWLFKTNLDLSKTASIYTVVLAPYQPLFQLASLPTLSRLLGSLSSLKTSHIPYQLKTPVILYSNLVNNSFLSVLIPVNMIVSIFALGLLAHALVSNSTADKRKVFDGLALGLAVGGVLATVLNTELQTFIYYSFMKAAG